jgi:oligoendopeptidase F
MKRLAIFCGALAALPLLSAASLSAPAEMRQRDEIPAEYRWDFSPIFADWDAWEAGLKDLQAKTDAFVTLKGTLASGPDAVLAAYKGFDSIGMLGRRVYAYTALQRDVDTRNQDVSGKFQRAGAMFAKLRTATAWFTPELLKIPQATMEKWIDETPGLAPYRFGIMEAYRQQAHVLDESGEQLLSYASRFNTSPRDAFQELSTSDIKFPRITLADGTEITASPAAYRSGLQTLYNQQDRGQLFEAHMGAYAATVNTYAALYNGVLQRDWFLAQSRHYENTLDAALDDDAVPAAVVENLIETARRGTAPLQRYARLRKKLLGLEHYHPYDSAIPIYRSETKYPYDQARELVTAAIGPLGPDYVSKFRQFTAGGRVDVYESEGKRSGAYSAGVYGVGPYQLLNYQDDLDSVFTFAHEGGHAMHTVLAYENQPFATAGYTIFVAEVASTTNERFLLDKLLKDTKDPKERFLLLQHAVDSIVNTFYTQVLFADFELQAHRLAEQGQPVTAEVLDNLYMGLLKNYYGDSVEIDDAYKHTWARIPHFFNTPYYVYQYATCFASSAQLFRQMTTGSAESRKAATERYLTLLKSGGNDQPMKQLQKAGVDLSQPATVQAVVDQMDELVTRMEAEAAKIH